MINLREWALPIYTILMELAAGVMFLIWIARSLLSVKLGKQEFDRAIQKTLWIILLTITTSLAGAHFHLSRPWHSFFAVLNIKDSWLSREILFSLIFLILTVILCWLQLRKPQLFGFKSAVGWLAISMASATIYSMSRIYELPTQPVWVSTSTISTFFFSTILLGLMATPALLVMDLRYSELRGAEHARTQTLLLRNLYPWLVSTAIIVTAITIIHGLQQMKLFSQSTNPIIEASFQLLTQFYSILLSLRYFSVIAGVLLMVLSVIYHNKHDLPYNWFLVPSYLACLLVMIGEILGRFLFYALHVRIGL